MVQHEGLTPNPAQFWVEINTPDAFTTDGTPDEYLHVCIGCAIGRDELRTGLLYLASTLSAGGWMG